MADLEVEGARLGCLGEVFAHSLLVVCVELSNAKSCYQPASRSKRSGGVEAHLKELVIGRLGLELARVLHCFGEGGSLGNHDC